MAGGKQARPGSLGAAWLAVIALAVTVRAGCGSTPA